jgi:hypothetical protein
MYQLRNKAIERIVVGRRHAGMDDFDGDSFRFVASLDLWESEAQESVESRSKVESSIYNDWIEVWLNLSIYGKRTTHDLKRLI